MTQPLKVFFDVDHTILLSTSDGGWHLRPGLREVFQSVKDMGHAVYLWTASGKLHAQRVTETYGLSDLVTDCFDKDGNNWLLPDLVVDDDWFLVEKYSGVLVSQYREVNLQDRELYLLLDYLKDGRLPQVGA
ncbi:MAG: hypothetical protein EXR55_02650 [Dehalococcoidia bacterium]|nr:hypothetical protein [Dehalococcoidia bacterium]